MDIVGLISLISAITGIATLFIPDSWRSKKLRIAVCVILTSILSSVVIYQYNKLSRTHKVSKAAQSLIEKREMEFVHSGFIQASLAFLEQNRDLYPDSYRRGIQVASESKDDRIYGELNAAYEIE